MSTLVDDLIWLIGVPSVTGEEEELCTALARRLSPRFGARAIARVGNSLVVGRPTGKPQITLYGHLDTVPAQGNQAGRLERNRVFGLGASDMKSGLAVMLGLLEDEAVRMGPYDVIGVFYDKEEGPAHANGLEDVLDALPWLGDAEFAVVLEPTDLQLELGCQGALNATVSFLGTAAHSARPWLGVNAISRAVPWLADMSARQSERVDLDGLQFLETFNVTMASGGVARNVIPARFDLNLNYRFPPDRTLAQAEARLREVASVADLVEIVDRAPPAPIPKDNPHLDRLAAVSRAQRNGKQAWTDVARLSARGIPAVNYGPGETAEAHRATESVAAASLRTAFEALQRFLTA
ncbi:MAG: succinyl-diaminopimelate desuccinylase [Actinobacteria bacterium]|nr:succinyl-diaminopimelate desuccinylase [Actinomycetota bacterium]